MNGYYLKAIVDVTPYVCIYEMWMRIPILFDSSLFVTLADVFADPYDILFF
jgi:hypothetical protein